MNEWLVAQGIGTPQAGLWLGILAGLLLAGVPGFIALQRALRADKKNAILETRAAADEEHLRGQISALQLAEQRLGENFERLAGKIFEERSGKLSELNRTQLEVLLGPLSEKLTEFRNTVTETHRQETAQHHVMQAKLQELGQLNVRLHEDATNLTRALTASSKSQGNWGEQQLERLLQIAGLAQGREFSTQLSVIGQDGNRVQPDLVIHLPEGKSIVIDSKVSLTAWTRYQAEPDDASRSAHLKDHVQSLRNHIRNLADKRYSEVPELQSLDFVVLFVPIEAALIEALQTDAELPVYALERKVALLSATNLLVTLRTVASVWSMHKQNSNAMEIANRAGLLYDKFAGFVEKLRSIGERLRQAQQAYDEAFAQLSTGSGNLVRQTELLRELGARHSRQLDSRLTEAAAESIPMGPAEGADNPGRLLKS